MVHYVYAIQNNLGGIYIGQTNNLEKRLKRHNNKLPNKKLSFTAKNKGNWRLIYKEIFHERNQAIRREKELKSFQGRQFIKKLLDKNMGV
jgi:putative endonuclease